VVFGIHVKFKTDLVLVFKDVLCFEETFYVNFLNLIQWIKGSVEATGTLIEFISVRFILYAEMNKCMTFEASHSYLAIKPTADTLC
jgi:hypothetical protein